jgi:MYXO-CTERM domain-containing protein
VNEMMKYGVVLLCVAGSLVSPAVRADPTQPPACITKGDPCQLGAAFGTCVDATCMRDTGDGPMQYACLVCDTSGGGAAGAPSTAGAGGTPGSAGAGVGGTPGSAGTGVGGTPGSAGTGVGGTPGNVGGASSSAGTGGKLTTAGAGGSPSSAGTSSVAGSAGAPTTNGGNDSGCSCSVRQFGTERNIAAFMLALGFVALGVSRRRR